MVLFDRVPTTEDFKRSGLVPLKTVWDVRSWPQRNMGKVMRMPTGAQAIQVRWLQGGVHETVPAYALKPTRDGLPTAEDHQTWLDQQKLWRQTIALRTDQLLLSEET